MSEIPTKVPPGPGFRARLIAFCGKQWPRYFFLGAIGFIIRLPAIQGGLIWDDIILTRDNPFIKSPLLALETFRHYLFLDSLSGHYRPVQNLSYMFDYISGRADSLAFVFSAGAWLLVLRARIAKTRWLKGILYPLAALAGVLALCSREIACIWMLIFLVHTLAFARDIDKKVKITTIV